jgi:TRAP-type uncharacterized transport system fused permease subunit
MAAPKTAAELDRPVEIPEEEFAGLRRTLAGFEHGLFYALAAGFTLYHLVVLNLYPQEALVFRATHVAWGAVLGFALYRPFPARADRPGALVRLAAHRGLGCLLRVPLSRA